MLARKVERIVHFAEYALDCDKIHEVDAANAQARSRVAKSAQQSAAAQPERSSLSVDRAL